MIEKKVKIVEVLLNNKELSIREISKLSKMDYKDTYYTVKNLLKEKILKRKRVGKANLISLKSLDNEIVILAEYNRRRKILKNKNIKIIFSILKKLKFQFIALIFGSFLKEKRYSDIDLLIICEEKRENEIREALSILPLNLHLTFITYEEFIVMLKSKEFNVVNEALKNYVLLVGIEDFYRVIENAK